MQLTPEQEATIHELQAELADLDLKRDIEWAKYVHTKDEDCWTEVLALESEREMLGLIAYVPKAGEAKVGKVRKLIEKVQGKDGPLLGSWESRLKGLDAINAWRAEYELPPLVRLPKGIPGNSEECVFAKAFITSIKEMGGENIDVRVQSGDDIGLNWMAADGTWHESRAELGEAASQVISSFDENAWLDLLQDSALKGYASGLADEGSLSRLQEVSDEFAIREQRLTVDGFDLGKGADPVKDQAAAQRDDRW